MCRNSAYLILLSLFIYFFYSFFFFSLQSVQCVGTNLVNVMHLVTPVIKRSAILTSWCHNIEVQKKKKNPRTFVMEVLSPVIGDSERCILGLFWKLVDGFVGFHCNPWFVVPFFWGAGTLGCHWIRGWVHLPLLGRRIQCRKRSWMFQLLLIYEPSLGIYRGNYFCVFVEIA